ncbi:MAG TPA: endonuclease/exonuclease/phosphatase family protein [Vicinamibacterales bacterium]|nr:endonuclease/exonuclease/phosphatase family protein [Vicinamibacterales bacterium]
MRSGTYRGVSDELTIEIRVDQTGAHAAVSGDINLRSTFVASFIATAPTFSDGMVAGAVQFRGNPRLFTGAIELKADDRGIGVFQLGVDLEGGFRDIVAGRAEWSSSRLRKLTIEVDGLAGMPFHRVFKNRAGSEISIESAFATAGFDVQVIVDPFEGGQSDGAAKDGFTYAELHRAMRERRNPPPADRLQAHVFVANYLAGKNGRNVLGVMYDFAAGDLNKRPREGVAIFGRHPLLSDPRVGRDEREREYVFTLVHEVGHALNMLHSFDKGRPAALSWMNYPHLFPLGTEAGPGHNGTSEFWAAFEQTFDDLEAHHLRHATPREIRSGGFAFGVYEEGPSSVYMGGTANPRLTQLGSNPLRQAPDVTLQVKAAKDFYNLGEPIFVELTVKATGRLPVRVPEALDPSEGFTRFVIEWPDGHRERYAPPLRVCMRVPTALQTSGTEMESHAIPLFLAARGPLFTVPGRYRLWTELAGIDGNKVAFADPLDITIVSPDLQTQRFAEKLWTTPGALEAMYLRHPLAEFDAWQEITAAADDFELGKKPHNATAAYLAFVGAMGWSRPFQYVDRRAKESDLARMLKRLREMNPEGLPPSIRKRAQAMLQEQRAPRSRVVVSSAKDLLRESIPPNGLFGDVGLDLPSAPPPSPINPFIVVPFLKGKPSVADIVSWNIQHFHGSTKNGRIETIAEYMDTFRCDFWGLQETDAEAVEELVDALNARGNLEYGFECVEGKGQQSSCIFRKDTTRVRKLPLPAGLFDGKVQVVKKKTGEKNTKKVFLRDPLICDVRVVQGNLKAFDFRCAIVHTKAFDNTLKDTGTGMRQAASRALEKWVTKGLEEGSEKDFLVMGDMNAEEAKEGLSAFAKSKKMKLLSVGMRAKHGKEGERGAITRFKSGRLLDHIAITSDTVSFMPKGDEKEQIIIRSDVSVKGFTKPVTGSKPGGLQQFKFSDHIPVAVRFIISKDTD